MAFNFKSECISESNEKTIDFADAKGGDSILKLVNDKKMLIQKIQIDGCELNDGDEIKRCDYLAIDQKGIEYFIELKGSDIRHGLKQLENSVLKFSKNPNQQKKFALISCSKNPLSDARRQNYSVKFRKEYNARLRMELSPFTFHLD